MSESIPFSGCTGNIRVLQRAEKPASPSIMLIILFFQKKLKKTGRFFMTVRGKAGKAGEKSLCFAR